MFRSVVLIALLITFSGMVTAQGVAPDRCPTLSVTGPSGVPVSGEPMIYEASISGPMPKEVTYRWTVSGGVIADGQGTKRISVVYPKESEDTITATFKILGLPKGCPAEASESVTICGPPAPILIDEFPTVLKTIDKERFRVAVGEQKNNPNDQLYIIEYFPSGTSAFDIRERHRKLSEFLVRKGELDESSITIITAERKEPLTKIYRIPPGATNPAP